MIGGISAGILGALDTLVSQAFGAGQHELCTVYMQRARFLNCFQGVLAAMIFWNMTEILLFLHQDPEVAYDAKWPARVLIISNVLYNHGVVTAYTLKNRGDLMSSLASFTAGNVIHLPCCAYLVVFCRLGNLGSMISSCIAGCAQLFWLCYYITKRSDL